jgi:hypothetical protein
VKEVVDEVNRKLAERRAARKATATGLEDQPFGKVQKFSNVFRNDLISQGLWKYHVCVCFCACSKKQQK